MSFFEKWYWANYIKGTSPIGSFMAGIVKGIWIPFLLLAIFCLFTGFNYFFMLKAIFYYFGGYTIIYIKYFFMHLSDIQCFCRGVVFGFLSNCPDMPPIPTLPPLL